MRFYEAPPVLLGMRINTDTDTHLSVTPHTNTSQLPTSGCPWALSTTPSWPHCPPMATPRALLVDPDNALCYHLVSRCVRHAWLCGQDKRTRRDYSYRKSWLEQRLSHLGRCFAVDIYAQAIMSNHFHLVVYFDPLAASRWSNKEVAERWLEAFPLISRPQGNPLDQARHSSAVLSLPPATRHANLGCALQYYPHAPCSCAPNFSSLFSQDSVPRIHDGHIRNLEVLDVSGRHTRAPRTRNPTNHGVANFNSLTLFALICRQSSGLFGGRFVEY